MEQSRMAQRASRKTALQPKLTDAERHARFKDMAREIDASDQPEDFDKAFAKVAMKKDVPRSAKK
jgi:hypothetical protein